MRGIILQVGFKGWLTEYWGYVYGIIIVVVLAVFIMWAAEIVGDLKKNANEGKQKLWIFVLAAGFFFGVVLFLRDIAAMAGLVDTSVLDN